MSPDSDQTSEPAVEAGEKQLCTSCLFPNEPSAHFCAKCGAPINSYSAIAPFESAFAQGYVVRQAAARPKNLIVLVGIWLIFGCVALSGFTLVMSSRYTSYRDFAIGTFMLLISLAILWKTSWNYFNKKRHDKKGDV